MNTKNAAVKVGLLTVISLMMLIGLLVWLQGRGLQEGMSYIVRFNDVDGLREGAPVQLMGIRVGFVQDVHPMKVGGKYYVQVGFSLNDTLVAVPRGSTIAIEQSGIIGEKFLEITPPPLRTVTLKGQPPKPGIPVRFVYEGGQETVGTVEAVEPLGTDRVKIGYRIARPGVVIPENALFELKANTLLILPPEPMMAPDKDLIFTVENPLRIKEFLAIQLESAEALRVTNTKINQLLSDDTLDTLRSTLKNTETLTARASATLEDARVLFQTTSKDLEQLVASADLLSENINLVANNLNAVIGNPEVQADVKQSIASLKTSTQSLETLLQDPALKETLQASRDTSVSAKELVTTLKQTVDNPELQQRLDRSLTLMNQSLTELDAVLGNVKTLTQKESDPSLQAVLSNTQEATENLRRFSEKLKGRFVLFKLMF